MDRCGILYLAAIGRTSRKTADDARDERRRHDTSRRQLPRDRLGKRDGAIADEHRSVQCSQPTPAFECRRRIADGRLLDDAQTLEREERRVGNFVQGREHVAPMRIHPDADRCPSGLVDRSGVRDRVERRHADRRARADDRESLNGRDTDAQPGERSWSRCNREHVDVARRETMRGEQRKDLCRQTLGVRAGAVAASLVHDHIVVHERDASGARRRIQGEDSHDGS